MVSTTAATLPGALASGPALHALVRVELINGTIVVGRLLEMDAATMNLKLDAIVSTAVRRRTRHSGDGAATSHDGHAAGSSGRVDGAREVLARDEVEPRPVALRCVQGMVVRGACVRFVDFIREGRDGGTSYGEVETAALQVRPSE